MPRVCLDDMLNTSLRTLERVFSYDHIKKAARNCAEIIGTAR